MKASLLPRSILLLLILAAGFLLTPPRSSANGGIDPLEDELQRVLDSIVRSTGVPGATFAAILPDGKRISIASGFSDLGLKTPMPPGACMLTGSVGKTFVAATVLKLAEAKLLRLDDSVRQYFPGCSWYAGLPNGNDITLRMMLNHTSGIPEYVYDPEIWAAVRSDPDKSWTGEERLKYSCRQPAVFEAGTGWEYADANYILLGMVIETVTKKDFYDLVQEEFLTPLQLKDTRPAVGREAGCLVAGYTGLTEELGLPEKMISNGLYAFNPQLEWTGGGFVSTAPDLARWARNLYGGEVLTPAMKKEMLTPCGIPTLLPENTAYGLGVFTGRHDGTPWVGHTGFAPGYITVLQYLPDEHLSLCLQVNSDKLRENREACFNRLKAVVLLKAGQP